MSIRLVSFISILSLLLLSGCASTIQVDDAAAALSEPQQKTGVYRAAFDIIRETSPDLSESELRALRGIIHRPGYTPETREEAFSILEERDLKALKETIGFRLIRITALKWRRRLCEIIAERGWRDLSPALARAWAFPIHGWVETEFDRPEYLALAKLYGENHVIDVLFDMFLESNSVAQQGLRRSIWTLLITLGQRDRLAALLTGSNIPDDDLMLQDLRAGVVELGVVPVNHEEIIWIRKLRQPEWSEFWNDARAAVAALPLERKKEFELRDLAILITAAKHEPVLLSKTKDQLYDEVDQYLRSTKRHYATKSRHGYLGTNNETLYESRESLSWGDLAAMLMAVRAMRVPEVVTHLFAYAEADKEDRTTEYGGVIRLDSKNRFEILEFPPRVRYHDGRFEASQDMFDAGYGSIFHFHFHAQAYKNAGYAGPGTGDIQYANNSRANCLVMTFVDRNTLNLDYYRHDRIVVDLGEIRRK